MRTNSNRLFQSTPPARGATARITTPIMKIAFQSTPPARGATVFPACSINCVKISIHAPREGGDGGGRGGTHPGPNHFNPRPPRGGRPKKAHYHVLWRYISIHAPREGGDVIQPEPIYGANYFNPRPPRGGRRCILWPLCLPVWVFQSTPPARGATSRIPIVSNRIGYFNPRPPRGGRP